MACVCACRHRTTCPSEPVKCPYCQLPFERSAFDAHESYCGSRTGECEACGKQVVLRKLDEHTSLECDVLCAHLPHVQARIAAQAAKQEAGAATARPRRGVSGSEARMSAALGSAVLGDAASTVEAAARAKRLGDMLETAQLQSALLESALDAKRIERKAVREIDDEGAALGMYYAILRRLMPRSVLVGLLTPHVSCLSAALVEGASSSVGADSTKPGSPVSTFREVCSHRRPWLACVCCPPHVGVLGSWSGNTSC